VTVRLALTPDGRWEADGPELVEAARAAGFDALGMGKALASTRTAAAYAEAGLRCHEVLALVLGRDAEATVASAEQLAVAAETVRAEWVLTIFRSPLDEATAKVVARCAAVFAEAGAGMAAEFSPLGPITGIPAGLEVVDAAGPGRAGLMIDSWHFSFGASTWADLESVPLDRIAYVQFADALAPESDDLMHETMQRRVMPGDGVLELERFASTLLDRGYDGTVSVEVLNGELAQLPVPEFARRAHAAAARYWS
jgi:sugar phosphate isomerase/epimerase